ncbi:sporulation protein [Peribacillus cavernae]|uniref:Sporulation protein n=1 Tax=Peribacillus cavernae TaxID=1674310 RepID=A0A433HW97_9BACI|nr:sporulation protein [Peribacillus cavernae]MDQ0217944.1 sporulation-control protein [Peribacillus cavernae]RUQ32593.1 sporulation protein [Peribacillus cavernae]
MSVFNKVLASIGIGNAQVDTKLEREQFRPGDLVTGAVEIKGGSVGQSIGEIYLSLHTNFMKEHDDRKYQQIATIERFRLNEPFEIASKGKHEIPFSIKLPIETPLTYGKTKVWISTGLDIKNAVDPKDEDFIRIEPNELVESAFSALGGLGFKLKNADCEEAPHRFRNRLPFIQEFEFAAYSGSYRGKLDELEVVFFMKSSDEAEILIEVDRKVKGLAGLFAEAMETDETKVRGFISSSDIPVMKDKLNGFISRYV